MCRIYLVENQNPSRLNKWKVYILIVHTWWNKTKKRLMQHYCWAWWWDVNFLYCTGTKLDEVIHNNMFWHGCLHLWFTSWGVKNGKSSCGENVDYARPRGNTIKEKISSYHFFVEIDMSGFVHRPLYITIWFLFARYLSSSKYLVAATIQICNRCFVQFQAASD